MTEEKPKKPEVKKLEDMLPFNPFKVLGLRPKPLEEKYKKYASLNRRMLASTIDTLFAAALVAPIVELFTANMIAVRDPSSEELNAAVADPAMANLNMFNLMMETGKLPNFVLNMTIQMIALLVVTAICWKIWSSSPGKMLLKMKIVDIDSEQPLSNRQIILRALGYIPACAFFFIGIFWISFNKRRQGWHDKIAGTAVIIVPRKKTVTKEAL